MNTLELARELMGFRTVSPVKDPEVFEFLKLYFEDRGVDVQIHDIDGVKNLTAETEGGSGSSICFNGHLDVVEAGSNWEVTDPFEPVVKDGKLYGRGATDMKAGVAAQVKAFLDLHQDPDFDGSVTLMIVGDEEIGGENGTQKLVDLYYENGHGFDYAIVGEPTDLNVQVGTRGVMWIDVTLYGDTLHASRASQAQVKALSELGEALGILDDLEIPAEEDCGLPEPTLEVTKVDGDQTYNSIPPEVTLGLDVRYHPEHTPEEIVELVEQSLEDLECEVKVELKIDHGGAYKLDDSSFRQVAGREIEKAAGRKPEYITEGGASDGRFFAEKGTEYIELGLNQEMVHRRDEYCQVEEIERMRKSYYRIAKELGTSRMAAGTAERIRS